MKVFLLLVCCITAYASDSFHSVYQRGAEIARGDYSDKEKGELLIELYSTEIDKVDIATLTSHPELLFRRAFAWSEGLAFETGDFSEVLLTMKAIFFQMQNDFQFVLDHADTSSRLYLAAQLQNNALKAFLEISCETPQEFLECYSAIRDRELAPWATNPLARGKALRKEVFLNVQQDPSCAAAFYEYILLMHGDPEIALGYIQPDVVKVVGIVSDEYGDAELRCQIEYEWEGVRYILEEHF